MRQVGGLTRLATVYGLPVVVRELTIAGRRGRTYVLRSAVASVLSVAVLLAVVPASFGLGSDPRLGLRVFSSIAWVAMVAVVLIGPVLAAGSIASERREGTLGLLFLTDLRPLGIALGKLTSSAVLMFQLVLIGAPVLFSGMVLGGIGLDQSLHVVFLILCVGLGTTSVGLAVSAWHDRPVSAIGQAQGLVLIIELVPPLVGLLLGRWVVGGSASAAIEQALYRSNAFHALALELSIQGSGLDWMYVGVWHLGLVVVGLALTAWRLGSLRRVGELGGDQVDVPEQRAFRQQRARRKAFAEVGNPVYEAEVCASSGPRERRLKLAVYIGGAVLLVAVLIAVFVDVLWLSGRGQMGVLAKASTGILSLYWALATVLLGLAMVVASVTSLGQEREDGTLELLVASAMRPSSIVGGKLLGILRRLGVPLGIVQIQTAIGLALSQVPVVILNQDMAGGSAAQEWLFAVGISLAIGGVLLVAGVVHIAAVSVIAVSLGVRVRARTALAVSVAMFCSTPFLGTCCCFYLLPFVISAEVIAAAVVYHDLTVNLRRYALQR